MKNKLLVSVFAAVVAAFAFISCESKSDVMEVCDDLVKQSIHGTNPYKVTQQSPGRSLLQLEGENLTITEFEFLGDVDDDRLAFRTISFGNGTYQGKKVDTLHYEYIGWNEKHTDYLLRVTPPAGDPYTLIYRGNALITPDGMAIGGEGNDNTARVEKWESVINSFPNTTWEAKYEAEFVVDSIFEMKIDTTMIPPFIPPFKYRYDTSYVFTDSVTILSADTTCLFRYEFLRDPVTMLNTGRLYKKGTRSHYNRETAETIIDLETEWEYNFEWYFSDVTSEKKFLIPAISKTEGVKDENLSISGYKMDENGKPLQFVLGGFTYLPAVLP